MVMGDMEMSVDLAVVGGGPAGYGAAFRAADLGLDVALVDSRPQLGGVCLHEGCIPSKTLLHLAEVIQDSRRAAKMGVLFGRPEIDIEAISGWKSGVISDLAEGLSFLCKKRGVQYITGKARFEGPNTLRLEGAEFSGLKFKHGIIATGSRATQLPIFSNITPDRVLDSSAALELNDIPGRLLVIGGGYVGLELGYVYATLGSNVTLVEKQASILPTVDQDLAAPLKRHLELIFDSIELETSVSDVAETEDGVKITLQGVEKRDLHVDKVLVAVGRAPNTSGLGLENTGVEIKPDGAIVVDECQRTSEPSLLCVGDATGTSMLAHAGLRQGRVAAETIAGLTSAFDVSVIPAIVYTDPQIAWCGVTERQAKEQGMVIQVEKIPWKHSSRAKTMGETDGLTKVIFDAENDRIIGLGAVGRGAEGIIAEGVLGIEMAVLAEDLALCLHPHPTLSETIAEASELHLGTATHLLQKLKK